MRSVKDSAITIVRKGFMKAVEDKKLDLIEAEDVFEGAIEEIRSDLTLVTLSLQSPLDDLQAEKHVRGHATNLVRFLDPKVGFSRTVVRMLVLHLQAEMSDQLHSLHNGSKGRLEKLLAV